MLAPLSAVDPGGTSFSVGVWGGLPPLSSSMAASADLVGVLVFRAVDADSVGVLVFRAGDDRCRGLIGSSNVVCGVVN